MLIELTGSRTAEDEDHSDLLRGEDGFIAQFWQFV